MSSVEMEKFILNTNTAVNPDLETDPIKRVLCPIEVTVRGTVYPIVKMFAKSNLALPYGEPQNVPRPNIHLQIPFDSLLRGVSKRKANAL